MAFGYLFNVIGSMRQNNYKGKLMEKTILITGSSSGIGKATAQYFFQKVWNVTATMRKPEDEKEIKESSSMKLCRLDVQSNSSMSCIKSFSGGKKPLLDYSV
jgi:NADP-dependent 3-hydroxy acid dehydrogenase YdfG